MRSYVRVPARVPIFSPDFAPCSAWFSPLHARFRDRASRRPVACLWIVVVLSCGAGGRQANASPDETQQEWNKIKKNKQASRCSRGSKAPRTTPEKMVHAAVDADKKKRRQDSSRKPKKRTPIVTSRHQDVPYCTDGPRQWGRHGRGRRWQRGRILIPCRRR